VSGRSNNRDRRETGKHGRVAKKIEVMLSFDASLLRPSVKPLSNAIRVNTDILAKTSDAHQTQGGGASMRQSVDLAFCHIFMA
jgi:hypothetical protein